MRHSPTVTDEVFSALARLNNRSLRAAMLSGRRPRLSFWNDDELDKVRPMSTAQASQHPRVSMFSLAGRALASLPIPLREELCRQAASGASRAALEALFEKRFGEQPDVERIRFLFFAAPMVRRLVIGAADPKGVVGGTEITFADVKSWLEWLDSMDPLCARMIDLRYFGGLTVIEPAKLLDLPPAAILRELRFARSWLTIKGVEEPATS